ncbi:hypothetical protein BMETH_277811431497, partial [methanotrophic bacterial endosymbiont of Bathymodiolus sp.]
MSRKNNSSSKGSISTTNRVPSDSENIAPASMPPSEIPSIPGHKTQAQ